MGPCLCGDPYCSSCGNPEAARLEEAADAALEQLAKANLTVEEYALAVKAGLHAVLWAREAVNRYAQERNARNMEEMRQKLDEST